MVIRLRKPKGFSKKAHKSERGKEEVNGPRKPKELSSKPLGTIRANEKVNGPGMSRK